VSRFDEIRRERIECDHGAIEITYPSVMSSHDVQDFEDRIKIMIRVLRRMAINDEATSPEMMK